jgi:hypothetical protein
MSESDDSAVQLFTTFSSNSERKSRIVTILKIKGLTKLVSNNFRAFELMDSSYGRTLIS